MRLLAFMVTLCLTATSIVANDDVKDETKRVGAAGSSQGKGQFQYDGIWKPKGAMMSGVLLPPPALKAITLKIVKDKYEVTVEGEDQADQGTFILDETTTPKRMTIKSTAGPNQGKTFLAIYEIKNANAFRVCYDLTGKGFPADFKAPKGSERYLVGYRRQLPDSSQSKPDTSGTRDQQ